MSSAVIKPKIQCSYPVGPSIALYGCVWAHSYSLLSTSVRIRFFSGRSGRMVSFFATKKECRLCWMAARGSFGPSDAGFRLTTVSAPLFASGLGSNSGSESDAGSGRGNSGVLIFPFLTGNPARCRLFEQGSKDIGYPVPQISTCRVKSPSNHPSRYILPDISRTTVPGPFAFTGDGDRVVGGLDLGDLCDGEPHPELLDLVVAGLEV